MTASPNNTLSAREHLIELLAQLPPQSIWRDIHDKQGTLLAKGAGVREDGIDHCLDLLDFKGKSVLDLGCNLGHNSLAAAQRGACRVLGVDSCPQVKRGAELVAEMLGIHNVHYVACDFKKNDLKGRWDMVMLIDTIGKKHVQKTRLGSTLKLLAAYAKQEIVLTVRPIYRIPKHFKMSPEEFAELYPGPNIQGKHFHLGLQVADMLGPEWQLVTPLKSVLYDEDTDKIFMHFQKVNPYI